ncbi:MAG: hypothetical protein R6U98_03470 [Pirellulaceae bacterium]
MQHTYGMAVSTLLILLSVVTLVGGPVLITEWPREVARWYQAAADEAELNQEYVVAEQHLSRAIAWNDTEPRFHAQRARLKLETGEWDSGLKDCERARELGLDTTELVYTRSQLLMRVGRHEAAIAELTELLQESKWLTTEARAELVNSLAYAHAVGKHDLQEGLRLANEALDVSGTRIGILDPLGYLQFHRGYTLFAQDKPAMAAKSLNKAVQSAQTKYRRAVDRLKVLDELPPRQQGRKEDYREQASLLKSHLAGILSLRADVWDALEQPGAAKKTRKKIDQLAPEGNLAMAEPSDFMDAVRRLQDTSNKLDTRGFLHYQRGHLNAARRDMHDATTMIDAICSTFSWQKEAMKYRMVDMRRLMASHNATLQGKAVMYYHQMLVHQALGMDQAAEKDRNQVVQLGYEPTPRLF